MSLDPLAPPTPRLPRRWSGALTPLAISAALHVAVAILGALLVASPAGTNLRRTESKTDQTAADLRQVVFLPLQLPPAGRGGGGGGNRQPDPIRRAQGIGSDRITLRVRSRPSPATSVTAIPTPVAADVPPIPSIVLDAIPLASGLVDQIGLPAGGLLSGISTGAGSGGGVGTGTGMGLGSGRGPGLGTGSGGGTGGGVYHVGGGVSAPRLIKEVRPKYTTEALRNHIQGTVVLEAIISGDGCPSHIRVVRSLDAGGLDNEAVAAVAQWRFEPGRLGGTPVGVLVTILVDFLIR
jgi:protein TonB